MKKALVLGATAVAFGMGIAAPLTAAPVKLKFGIFTPAKEPTYKAMMVPFAREATRDSNGTIQIDTFPGGSLGKNPRAQLKLAIDGVVDMTWIVPSYTPGRFPDNGVFELPGLFNNVQESSHTIWRMFEKNLLRGYQNVFVVSLFLTHPYFIHAKPKVTKLSDLKGLKIRAAGPVFGASIRALGAVPVGMPAPAIAENISRGVINGAALEWNGHYAFRTKDVAKFTLISNSGSGLLGTVPLATVMNKKIFDGLPADGRKSILKHHGLEMTKRFAKLHDAINKKLRTATEKNPDHTVTRLSADEQNRFDSIMKTVVADWEKRHDRGKELLAAVRSEVRAIRAGK